MKIHKNEVRVARFAGISLMLFSMLFFMISSASAKVKLRYITIQSPTSPIMMKIQEGLDAVTKETGGEVEFQIHYGSESGYKAKQYAGVFQSGLVDAGLIATSASAFEFPWLGVFGLPFICPSFDAREPLMKGLQLELEAFCKEHNIIPLAFPLHYDPWLILYSTRDIGSLADFKGMLVRCYDPNTIELTKGLGATPVSLQKSEIYQALQKGTIDGAITGSGAAKDLHFDEVAKYEVKIHAVFLPNILGFSANAWKKLTAEQQDICKRVFTNWEMEYWKWLNDPKEQEKAFDYAKSKGVKIIDPAADIKAVFPAIKDKTIEIFLKKSGDQGAKVLKIVNETLIKIGK